MGYKTKSMINQKGPGQLPGFDIENLKSIDNNLKKLTTKFKGINETKAIQEIRKKEGPSGAINTSNLLQENLNKESSKSSSPTKAKKKQDKSIGTYVNEGGEKKYKKSQRKEARAVGKEAAKNVDTSFEGAKLAGTDFNSLLIGTIQNISESGKASGKKRKIKRDARKEHQELQKKGSSNFDGKGLKEGFKGADLPKIDSGIKTGDFFQNTFNKFNPERDKRIKKGPQKPEKTIKNRAPKNANTIDSKLGDDIMRFGINPNQKTAKGPAKDQYDFNPPSYIDRTIEKIQDFIGVDKLPAPRELFGFQMTGDGFNKGMLRKNKYKK